MAEKLKGLFSPIQDDPPLSSPSTPPPREPSSGESGGGGSGPIHLFCFHAKYFVQFHAPSLLNHRRSIQSMYGVHW